MKKLRWGLLSTAKVNRHIIPLLQSSKNNELVAVASRSLEKARSYANEWKISKAFGAYEELIASDEIDVIYNSLPNSMHAEWTIKAINAGKHVLCEKPIAVSVSEVDEIIKASKKAGVIVAEAFMYRHHSQTSKVKKLIDENAIGKVNFIRGSFTFLLSRENDIRLDPKLGGGSLWDVGCYPVSYILYLMGKLPSKVFGQQILNNAGVDEMFLGSLKFDNGIVAQFDCGINSVYRTQIEIVGSEGTISISNPFKPGINEKINIARNNKLETMDILGEDLYSGEIEDISNVILLGKSQVISLEESKANIDAISSLYQSAIENRPVFMSFFYNSSNIGGKINSCH